MGLAASQVRLLTLQNRKSTIGLRLGTLSQREIALSNRMDAIAKEYTDALDNKSLQWTVSTGNYVDITYDRIMTPMKSVNQCNPHIITDRNGRVVVDDKYNTIVEAHPEIFGPNHGNPPPSVMPAVRDYLTEYGLGELSVTSSDENGILFTRNTVTDTYYRDAKISEVFDYLADNVGDLNDSTVKSDINLIIKNYKNNNSGYNSVRSEYYMNSSNYYTSNPDDDDFYINVAAMVNADLGVQALNSLNKIPGLEYITDAQINQSIENAVRYFSDKAHVNASDMDCAFPEELERDVQGYMGVKVSQYSDIPIVEDPDHEGVQVYKYHYNNAAFSYRSFYDYILADLSGLTNAFTANGNTETNMRIVNDTPATVTIPSLSDMAMNIVTVAKAYASTLDTSSQLSDVTYSKAVSWLENGYYYTNSPKTANLNYCLEEYLNGSQDSGVLSTISSIYHSVFGNTIFFDDSYISGTPVYEGKTYQRDANSSVIEYWIGVNQNEVDFYTAVFEKIRDNGCNYVEGIKDKEYLNLQLQNNNYLIDGLYAKSCPKIAMVCISKKQQEEALSKYEAQMALVSEKEEDVQLEIESLNTEYSMIKSEISSVKKIIQDNIQATFKMDA